MRFAAPAGTSCPKQERKSARELMEYADLMMARGREEEEKQNLQLALKYYKLATRHRESWVELTCAKDRPQFLGSRPIDEQVQLEEVLTIRRRLEAELSDQGRPDEEEIPKPAWRLRDEQQFLKTYSYYYWDASKKDKKRNEAAPERRPKSPKQQHKARRHPWRAPSRHAQIPESPQLRRAWGQKRSASNCPTLQQAEPSVTRCELLDELKQEAKLSSVQKPETKEATPEMRALLEQKELQIAMLTRQLEAAGCAAVTEVVPLAEAKARLQRALEAMMSGKAEGAEVEAEVERLSLVIDNHPEQIEALKREHEAWIDVNEPLCSEALKLELSFVPPDVLASGTSKAALRSAGLTDELAARIYATPALWLLRAPHTFVARIHDADLRGKFGFETLDCLELRALWAAVKDVVFENDSKKAKANWRDGVVERLKRYTNDENLPRAKRRHPAYGENDALRGPFDPAAPVLPVRTASVDRQDDDDSKLSDDSTKTPSPKQSVISEPQTHKGSVVSQAVAQLRRSGSFGEPKSDRQQLLLTTSPSQRMAAERRRNIISPKPSTANLMAELKSSLLKRSGISQNDDDDEGKSGDADTMPLPRDSLSATSCTLSESSASTPKAAVMEVTAKAAPPKPAKSKPGFPSFAAEIQQLASARDARRRAQSLGPVS